MRYSLVIRLRLEQAALVRTLRLLERRSSSIDDIDVCTVAAGRARVRVTLDSRIPAEVMAAQVRKQYDVERVEVRYAPPVQLSVLSTSSTAGRAAADGR